MTNAIIMSAMLSTNWSGFVHLGPTDPPSDRFQKVENAEVYRYVTFHTMEGTNRINWGYTQPMRVGTISKTNGVLGPIIWDKP